MMDSGVLDRIYRWFMPLEGLKDHKENKEDKLVGNCVFLVGVFLLDPGPSCLLGA